MQITQQIPESRAIEQTAQVEHPNHDPRWLSVIEQAFGHRTWTLQSTEFASDDAQLRLALVSTPWFGRYLVSLPYLNSAGITTNDASVAESLIDQAVELADSLDVNYLELRNEHEYQHPQLQHKLSTKALLRLPLPNTSTELWDGFKSKLRSQIRNGERHSFTCHWGRQQLLNDFYNIFSRRMRELGTPVYSKTLFRSILDHFPESAEICCLRSQGKSIAVALLMHGAVVTEVPSACCLSELNSTNANMVFYWHLLQRAVERQNKVFDFGRSTINSSTYRFKQQWGAVAVPSVWQYYLRRGTCAALRPDNPKFSMAIKLWRRLPLMLTRLIGPAIVRGIP